VSRPTVPSSSYVKPTLDTYFHIDYDWWERSNQDLNLYLEGHLCEEHRKVFAGEDWGDEAVDWIEPETGLVSQVDRLTYTLLSHCSQQPDYITERTSLVDAVFRTLLAAGNRPMTPVELAERIGRPADVILRTLSGRKVYKGLRPVSTD
jgi:hypothetical protein